MSIAEAVAPCVPLPTSKYSDKSIEKIKIKTKYYTINLNKIPLYNFATPLIITCKSSYIYIVSR